MAVDCTAADLLYRFPDDAFLKVYVGPKPGEDARCWVSGQAGCVLLGGQDLVAVGDPAEALKLVRDLVMELPSPATRLTVSRAAYSLLSVTRLPRAETGHWGLYWTRTPPPEMPHENQVAELSGCEEEIATLLETFNPRHSVSPSDPAVIRWSGIRRTPGQLLACGALIHRRTTIPSLVSITTAAPHCGQGWGTAITAQLTRQALHSSGISTLGRYDDVTTHLYQRLGYHLAGSYSSIRLPRNDLQSLLRGHRVGTDDDRVEFSGDVAFEAADGFASCFTFGDASLDVGPAAVFPAETGQHDGVES